MGAGKDGEQITATDVLSLSLDLIRNDGPDGVAAALAALPDGGRRATIVANALVPSDMAVVALGCMQAERRGASPTDCSTGRRARSSPPRRHTAAAAPHR